MRNLLDPLHLHIGYGANQTLTV